MNHFNFGDSSSLQVALTDLLSALDSYDPAQGLPVTASACYDTLTLSNDAISGSPPPFSTIDRITGRGQSGLLNSLTAQGLPTDGLSLTGISLTLHNNATGSSAPIISMTVDVTVVLPWKIGFDCVKLEAIQISFTILNPFNTYNRSVLFVLEAVLNIDTVPIDVGISYPSFQLFGGLDMTPPAPAKPPKISLGQIITHFIPAVKGIKEISTLALTGLQLQADPVHKSGSVYVQISDDWTLFTFETHKFKLETASLFLDFSSAGTSMQMGSTLDVFGTGVYVTARHDGTGSGWQFSGGLSQGQSIGVHSLVEHVFGSGLWPSELSKVDITQLSMSFDTSDESFQFQGAVSIDFVTGATLAGILLPPDPIDIDLTLQTSKNAGIRTTSGTLVGTTTIDSFDITLGYSFQPSSKTLALSFDGYDCTLTQQSTDTTTTTSVTLQMGNLSFGELLTYVINKVDPGSHFSLSHPWSLLNDINLENLTLGYTSVTTKATKVKVQQGSVSYAINKDFGLFKIDTIGLAFTLGTKSVMCSVTGDFGGASFTQAQPLQWDMLNQNPPVPGSGNSVFELRYLGMGQHVGLTDVTNIDTVEQALNALETYATPPTASNANPFTSMTGIAVDSTCGWLFGADFTLIKTVKVEAVFNDPQLYGLMLSLSGAKAKSLAGLKFEILYKKINDNIGEYIMELKLPTAMRHLQFGEAAITLPVIDCSIFTNGNFEIDFGFPWNNQYANSFGIQVLPFTGAGGFYFGVLDGATAPQVPVISNGVFAPVIVFGFGMEVGLGKSISLGPLSGSVFVGVCGALQGCLAFFHATDKSVAEAEFFQLQGMIGLRGHVQASVNFVIINASIDILVYADAQLIYQSHQPLLLSMDVGVCVEVSVKVLFIHIHFHFQADVHESVTIGHPTSTPWILAPQQPALTSSGGMTQIAPPAGSSAALPAAAPAAASSAHGAPMMRSSEPQAVMGDTAPAAPAEHFGGPMAIPDKPVAPLDKALARVHARLSSETASHTTVGAALSNTWAWDAAATAYGAATPLPLAFFPAPSVSALGATQNTVDFVAQLLIENGGAAPPFSTLALQALTWGLKADPALNLSGLTPASAATSTVTYAQLKALHQQLAAGNLPGYSAVGTFLQNNFGSVTIANAAPGTSDYTVFPMIPALTLTAGQQSVDFSTFNQKCDATYLSQLAIYLQALAPALPKYHGVPSTAPIAPPAPATAETFAHYVFCDYFGLLLKSVVNQAASLLRAYPITRDSETAQLQLARYGVALTPPPGRTYSDSFTAFALENKDLTLQSQTLNLQGVVQQVTGSTPASLSAIAQTCLGSTPSASFITTMLTGLLFTENILAKGSELTLATLSYTVPNNLFSAICTQFAVMSSAITVLNSATTPVATTVLAPLTRLQISKARINATPLYNTLTSLALRYGCTPQALQQANPTLTQGINDPLPANQAVVIPTLFYTVPPDDAASLAAYFRIPASSISGTFTAGSQATLSGVSYTVDGSDSINRLLAFGFYELSNLAALLPACAMIHPGARVPLPAFSWTGGSQTLAEVAASFNLPAEQILFSNLETLLPVGTALTVPDACVTIQTLLTDVTPNLSNVAGMLSRFFLHGLRLPQPGQTILTSSGQANPAATTKSLYGLTGQQIQVDPSVPALSLSSAAGWVTFADGPSLSFALDATMSIAITQLQETRVTLPAVTVDFVSPYRTSVSKFSLQHPIDWRCATTPAYLDGSTPTGVNPMLWLFSEELAAQLAESGSLALELYAAARSLKQSGGLAQQAITALRWATLLTLPIRQVSGVAGVYALERMSSHVQLEQLDALLAASGQGAATLSLLYDNNPTGSDGKGLQSDPYAASAAAVPRLFRTRLDAAQPEQQQTQPLFTLDQFNWTPQTFINSTPTEPVLTTVTEPGGNQVWELQLPVAASSESAGVYWAGGTKLPPNRSAQATGICVRLKGANGREQICLGITPLGPHGTAHYLSQQITLTADWQSYVLDFATVGLLPEFFNFYTHVASPFTPFTVFVQGGCVNPASITIYIDQNTGVEFVAQEMAVLCDADLNHTEDWLTLLQSNNVLQGVYLHYPGADGKGLPDHLFSDGGSANLRLLALCPTTTTAVQPFHNCVALGAAIDRDSQTLYASDPNVHTQTRVLRPGHFGFEVTCPATTSSGEGDKFTPLALGNILTTFNTPQPYNITMTPVAPYQGTPAWQLVTETNANPPVCLWLDGAWGFTPNHTLTQANGMQFRACAATPTTVQFGFKLKAAPAGSEQVIYLQSVALTAEWQVFTLLFPDSDVDAAVLQALSHPTQMPFMCQLPANAPPVTFYVDQSFGVQYGVQTVLDPTTFVREHYNLLTCQVENSGGFQASIQSMPMGPARNAQDAPYPDLWHYHKVLPLARLVTPASAAPSQPGWPEPANDPYLPVGNTLTLNLAFQDLYGNQTAAQTPQTHTVGYTDALIPVSQWPGVTHSYAINSDSGVATLEATLHFDLSRYLSRAGDTLAQGVTRALNDRLRVEEIFYQISQKDVAWSLTSSIGACAALPATSHGSVQTLVGSMYVLLDALRCLNQVSATASATTTLSGLLTTYRLALADLTAHNAGSTTLFAQQINRPAMVTVQFGDSLTSLGISAAGFAQTYAAVSDVLAPDAVLATGLTKPATYTVKAGDTLAGIATTLNTAAKPAIPLTAETLIAQNLQSTTLFASGARLLSSVSHYTWQISSDCLTSLAQTWNCSAEEIAFANLTTPLNPGPVTLPGFWTLTPDTAISGTTAIQTLTTLSSLQGVAAAVVGTAVLDIAWANRGLTQVLTGTVQMKSGSYSIAATDTLGSVYGYFVAANPDLTFEAFAAAIASQPIFSSTAVLLMPPAAVVLSSALTANLSAEILPLTASLKLARSVALIDALASDVPHVQTVSTHLSPNAASSGDSGSDGLSLRQFANQLEQALPGVKVAAHRSGRRGATRFGRLWVLPLQAAQSDAAPTSVTFNIQDGSNGHAVSFAPVPLSTKPLDRNGVTLLQYASGKGLQPGVAHDFRSINLDQWAQTCLQAIETYLAPSYAGLASAQLPSQFAQLVGAKAQIAQAISAALAPVLLPQQPIAKNKILAARQTLQQSLLTDLTAAYKISALVQLDVAVKKPAGIASANLYLIGKPSVSNLSDTTTPLSLSTARIPLQQDAHLTFALQAGQDAAHAKNLSMDLAYDINGVQAALDKSGDNVNLNFLIPLKTPSPVALEVPLPLRSFPSTPILSAQHWQVIPPATVSLSSSRQWLYRMDFQAQPQVQDEVEVSVVFTEAATNLPTVTGASHTGVDLFGALAQLTTLLPKLEADLAPWPHAQSTLSTQLAQTAFSTLAELTAQAAAAWTRWTEVQSAQTSVGSQGFRALLCDQADAQHNFQVMLNITQGQLPTGAALTLMIADPSGGTYTPSVITMVYADLDTGQIETATSWPAGNIRLISVIFSSFTLKPGGAVLAYPPHQPLDQRSLIVEPMDILQTPMAWGGVALNRNRDMVSYAATNPVFVYETPLVRFIDGVHPAIKVDTPIYISKIGSTTGQAQTRTLDQHLAILFQHLLELGDPTQLNRLHRLKVACVYEYALAGTGGTPETQLSSHVPVLLHPEFVFDIHDWELNASARPTFVERMSTYITEWQTASAPETSQGAYVFEITLQSGSVEDQRLLNFLIHNNTRNLLGALSATGMPLSFYVPNAYWSTAPNNQADPYSISSVAERALAYYGADIYDVATMQIALSLFPNCQAGMDVAQNWTRRLLSGQSGQLASIRAWTTSANGKLPFLYGGATSIPEPDSGNAAAGAYFIRMISDQKCIPDPVTHKTHWPDSPPTNNLAGKPMHWIDWKPITGENAWGALLGPLQLEYRRSNRKICYSSDGVQLALKVIPAYQAMQHVDSTGAGAIYYAPANCAANQGGEVNPLGVSNENNFSSFAALTELMEALAIAAQSETDAANLQAIYAVFGDAQELACGIQTYFKNNLVDLSSVPGIQQPTEYANAIWPCFYTGGAYSSATSATFTGGGGGFPFAVDVHTWGCAVLGVDKIDAWFGDGMVYKVWQTAKKRAGYFVGGHVKATVDNGIGVVDGTILGVGYTDVNQDPALQHLPPDQQHQYIISAEWTFGAINMCRVIAAQYQTKADQAPTSAQQQVYLNYAASLLRDASTMIAGVRWLLLDTSRADQEINAYYYANRRYDIPFGWYANRVASLCSTSWAVMVSQQFNPFMLGGSYYKQAIDPTTYSIGKIAAIPDAIGFASPALELLQAGVPQAQTGLVKFLIDNTTATLTGPPAAYATGMPLSFYVDTNDPNNYWNQLADPNSPIYDVRYAAQATSTDGITERVLVHYGVDIYDAATMQAALAIFPALASGMNLASGQTQRLLRGFSIPNKVVPSDGPSAVPASTVRGWTDPTDAATFYYGANQASFLTGKNKPGAYFFRSISDQDTLTDSITGETTAWPDWKPITGENAWGAIIGPLQAAYSACSGAPPMDHPAVQLAVSIVDCLQAMQSSTGGLFYAPWNMAPNAGTAKADPFSLSNENNFSSLAALLMLEYVLQKNGDTQYLPTVQTLIQGVENYLQTHCYDSVNSCIYTGGSYSLPPVTAVVCLSSPMAASPPPTSSSLPAPTTPTSKGYGLYSTDSQGDWSYALNTDNATVTALATGATLTDTFPVGTNTITILISGNQSYTVAPAGNNQVYYNSGVFTPWDTKTLFAVDVHTWGCTVMGLDRIDTSWFGTGPGTGPGTAYNLWQTVKARAGYFAQGDVTSPILGVGYTDVTQDPTISKLPADQQHQYIISAEWTFGAITMCRVLAQQYGDAGSQHYNAAYAASLNADADSMEQGVATLLCDSTSRGPQTQAYYYANRRYDIPFGWHANRIDSLCSTAWAVMVQNRFNPFVLGGDYSGKVSTVTLQRPGVQNKPLIVFSELRLALTDISSQ